MYTVTPYHITIIYTITPCHITIIYTITPYHITLIYTVTLYHITLIYTVTPYHSFKEKDDNICLMLNSYCLRINLLFTSSRRLTNLLTIHVDCLNWPKYLTDDYDKRCSMPADYKSTTTPDITISWKDVAQLLNLNPSKATKT